VAPNPELGAAAATAQLSMLGFNDVTCDEREMSPQLVCSEDGLLTLWHNDRLAAEHQLSAGPCAGVALPFGLNIGAWPDDNQRM
jgi:hypothetical protein